MRRSGSADASALDGNDRARRRCRLSESRTYVHGEHGRMSCSRLRDRRRQRTFRQRIGSRTCLLPRRRTRRRSTGGCHGGATASSMDGDGDFGRSAPPRGRGGRRDRSTRHRDIRSAVADRRQLVVVPAPVGHGSDCFDNRPDTGVARHPRYVVRAHTSAGGFITPGADWIRRARAARDSCRGGAADPVRPAAQSRARREHPRQQGRAAPRSRTSTGCRARRRQPAR